MRDYPEFSSRAIGGMLVSFQNSYVEVVTPSVMVLGGGAFKRQLGLD